MTRRTPLLLCAALLAVACKPKVVDLPICPEMVAAGAADESQTRELPIDVWFSILIRGFDRTGMDPGDEARECSNQPIAVTWPQEMATDPRASARKLPRDARTADDLTFSDGEEGEILVWARIEELENGDALGPVGLARWIARGLEVRGIGTIQAPAERVRMRLEPYGEIRMLVLESETCPKDQADAAVPCPREVQIMPLENQRFVSAHMFENDKDMGPARFLLVDDREEPLKDGWVRKYDAPAPPRVRRSHRRRPREHLDQGLRPQERRDPLRGAHRRPGAARAHLQGRQDPDDPERVGPRRQGEDRDPHRINRRCRDARARGRTSSAPRFFVHATSRPEANLGPAFKPSSGPEGREVSRRRSPARHRRGSDGRRPSGSAGRS
jgi:hypothetical protein